MNVLMVTPHLPPHQAANALLPHLLGHALARRGHGVRYLAFGSGPDRPDVRFVRRRGTAWRATRIPQALEAVDTWRQARDFVAASDVVHVHSNTWMNQVAARLAERRRTPYVLTHYGTEIWHADGHDPAFHRLNAGASGMSFYSQALLERAQGLGLPVPGAEVIYPPVADGFRPLAHDVREAVRARWIPQGGALLLNVKRLHPLADHDTLLHAMARLSARGVRATLLVAGTGEREAPLRALARQLGVTEQVRFLGLVPNDDVAALQGAADLFVLSSRLEATPTVALEALACGTPVVSTDNPGGVELRETFGEDVEVVPREDPDALAAAVAGFLAAPRRTRERTAREIEAGFRLDGVVERYLELYRKATAP